MGVWVLGEIGRRGGHCSCAGRDGLIQQGEPECLLTLEAIEAILSITGIEELKERGGGESTIQMSFRDR